MPVNVVIGVAYPWTERDRAALREACPNLRIPLVPDGSRLERCHRCDVQVTVGPRLQATDLRVVCALCAHVLGMEGF